MRPSVVEQVVARAVEGGWCRRPTKGLVYNNFDRTTSSVLLHIFSCGAREPAVVAKLCTKVEQVRREFDNLWAVRMSAPDVAPVPLFFERVAGYGVLGMEAISGRQASGWVECRDRVPAVMDVLVRLHSAMQQGNGRDGDLGKCIEETVELMTRQERDVRARAAAARIGGELMEAVEKGVVRATPQHGDFHFDNMLFRGEKVFVMDWEDFGEVFLPAYDLFSLVMDFFTPWKAGGVERFFEDARLGEALRAGIRSYFTALGLPLELAVGLLGFTVLRQVAYSEQLGRSGAETLWKRLQGYFDNAGHFARMLGSL